MHQFCSFLPSSTAMLFIIREGNKFQMCATPLLKKIRCVYILTPFRTLINFRTPQYNTRPAISHGLALTLTVLTWNLWYHGKVQNLLVSCPFFAPKRGNYIDGLTAQWKKLIKESLIWSQHKGMKKSLKFFLFQWCL